MSLQPANATALERALEHALALITEIPNPIDTLWDPWACPAQYLPWLAWQYSVDYWRPEWTETVKRQVIDAAYGVHRIKGTLPAIQRAINGLGIEAEIVRWFELDPPGEPYTMTVTAWAGAAADGNVQLDAAGQQDLIEMVQAAKALRTHVDIRAGARLSGSLGVAAICAPRQTLTAVTPAAGRDGGSAGIGLAAGAHVAPRFRAMTRAA